MTQRFKVPSALSEVPLVPTALRRSLRQPSVTSLRRRIASSPRVQAIFDNGRSNQSSVHRRSSHVLKSRSCLRRAYKMLSLLCLLCLSCTDTSSQGGDLEYGPLEWIVVCSIGLMALVLGFALLCLSVRVIRPPATGPSVTGDNIWQTTFFSSTIALFGVLIAGLFIFMSFRLDREARQTAAAAAERIAETAAQEMKNSMNQAIDVAIKRLHQTGTALSAGLLRLVPEDIRPLTVGSTLELEDVDAQRQVIEFSANVAGTYLITARAETGASDESDVAADLDPPPGSLFGFLGLGRTRRIDPAIYLYALEPQEQGELRLMKQLAEDDDGAAEGSLDSRLQIRLTDGTYFLEVHSLGAPGDVSVSVRRLLG